METVNGEEIKRFTACKDLNVGQTVMTCNSNGVQSLSKIEYITVQMFNGKMKFMTENVLITPWHPIFNTDSKRYVFPQSFPITRDYTGPVYNFVLENRANIILGNTNYSSIEAVTLGHGIKDDPVASHEYLGTSNVVMDIISIKNEQIQNGNNSQYVHISQEFRDKENKINKWV